MQHTRLTVGIDEVGRGPLAGPVAVCALAASSRVLLKFRDIKESKQLTPRARAQWEKRINEALGPELSFSVAFVSARVIDEKGISWAIRSALARALRNLAVDPRVTRVLLDGGLHAPPEYTQQLTIIRGDAKETVIAMASVVAKVARDRVMQREDARYPVYGFAVHKGYGTAHHREAIRTYGLSSLHRKSFCTRIL